MSDETPTKPSPDDFDELFGDSNKPTTPQTLVDKPSLSRRENIERKDSKRISLGGSRLISYDELHWMYSKWLYLEPQDHEVLDVIWAVALDRDVPGDPLWLYYVAPSGGGKSEQLMSLALKFPKALSLSALTPQTLVSGKLLLVPGSRTQSNPKGDYVLGGLLKKLDGRVLIIKDLTVILSMKESDRYEIISQFRDAFDGSYTKAFGNVMNPVTAYAVFGFIAGVTPVIDFHQKMNTMLGERFLKVRSHPDDFQTTQRAHENAGKEKEMRKDLSNSIGSYLTNLDFRHIPECSEEQDQQIIKMAQYVAKMRAWVFVKVSRNGEIIDVDVPEAESPTRAVKQLTKLAAGLALIRGHSEIREEDIKTLRRVSKDTGIPKRQKIVDAMMTNDKEPIWSIRNLAELSGMHVNSVKIECEKMRQLLILIEQKGNFSFTPEFIPLVEGVYGKAVPSGTKGSDAVNPSPPKPPKKSEPSDEPVTTPASLDDVFEEFTGKTATDSEEPEEGEQ